MVALPVRGKSIADYALDYYNETMYHEKQSLVSAFFAGKYLKILRDTMQHGAWIDFLDSNNIKYATYWSMQILYQAFQDHEEDIDVLFDVNRASIAKTAISDVARMANKGNYVGVDYVTNVLKIGGDISRTDVNIIKSLPPESSETARVLINSGVTDLNVVKSIISNPDITQEALDSGAITVPNVTEDGDITYVQKPLESVTKLEVDLAVSSNARNKIVEMQTQSVTKIRDFSRWVKTDVFEGTAEQIKQLIEDNTDDNKIYRILVYTTRD